MPGGNGDGGEKRKAPDDNEEEDDDDDEEEDEEVEEEEEEKNVERLAVTLGHAIAATAGAFDDIGEPSDPYIFVSTLPLGLRHVALMEAYHVGLAMMGNDDMDEEMDMDEKMPNGD